MNTMRTYFVLLAAAVLALPRLATAQANPDSVHHRNQCRLAEQVITTGNPATHTDWAWLYIDACDPSERAEAYLAALQQVRKSSDLRVIHRAVMPIVWLHDGRLFEAAMQLAADPEAATPARVVAFVALARVKRPLAAARYEWFIGESDIGGVPAARCAGRSGHAVGVTPGTTPLPTNYREQIAEMARRIADAPSQPRDVRSAASCTSAL